MIMSKYPFTVTQLKAALPAALFVAATLAQTPAVAQTSAADEAIEEITVTGIRRSLDVAADIKRESDSVVDAITAQDIGLFSDNNIGEALSRVPGVLLEREAGEGYRISIRGLGPRFVRTTVNGRTALSASGGETGNGDDARGFTYNILPSEVVSRAKVSKSTMAYEVEGGIGGVVDLETNRPLEFRPKGDNFYLSGTLRGTYNDLSEDTTYRGTIFLNNKFSENFGVFFAATLDQADKIDNLAESQRLRTFDREYNAGTLLNGVPLEEDTDLALSHFSGVRYQEQPIPRDRETYVTGIQWQNDNWDINFDWIAGFEDETREDTRFWYGYGDVLRRFNGDVTSLTVDFGDENLDISEPTLGTLVAYEFEGADDERRIQPLAAGLYRRVPRSSDINVGGLNLEWNNGDDWTVAVDFGYADQTTERILERLRSRLNTDWRDGTGIDRLADGVSGDYDIRSGYPIANLYDSNGDYIDPLDITHQYVELLERRIFWEEASDESFRLDFMKELDDRSDGDLYSFFDSVQFGFAFNSQKFSRDVIGAQDPDVSVYDMNTIRSVIADGILTDVNVPGFIHSFAVGDIADPVFSDFLTAPVIVTYTNENGDIVNPEGLYQIEQGETFDVTEDVTAFYLQGNFSGEGPVPYRGNIGVRYVDTEQTNFGWVGNGAGLGFEPVDPQNPQVKTSRDYDHVLPSFNLAFDLTDEWVLRFAANKALTRPDPIDMSSRLDLDFDDFEGSGGNPNLEPYTTVNYDMSVEWYPERGGSYGLGFFYKDLESFISSGSSTQTIDDDEYDIRRPINTDGGTINGVEFQFHAPLDFLPGFLQYFGINGSYTYVDAEMDAVVPDRGTPISLRGTSERSGNLVLYFEKEKFGARVAANYRSDYLFQEASDTDRFDEFTHGRTIVDMNLDYIIMENMKVRLSANNLTEERRSRFWDTPGRYYSDERDNGRTLVLEFRYTSD
jgi:TonB-dependent receptor